MAGKAEDQPCILKPSCLPSHIHEHRSNSLFVQQHSPAHRLQLFSFLLHSSFHKNGLGLSLSCCVSHSKQRIPPRLSESLFKHTRKRTCVSVDIMEPQHVCLLVVKLTMPTSINNNTASYSNYRTNRINQNQFCFVLLLL